MFFVYLFTNGSMDNTKSVDQYYLSQVKNEGQRTLRYGILFIIGGLLIQLLHLVKIPVQGFTFMVIIAGIILVGAGILFILGSFTVPKTRAELIARLQNIMLDHNPERRLWAAQRLVGYAKDANFAKEEVLALARHAAKMVKENPVREPYNQYVSVDHIILLREMAVSVPMNKHTRKDFVRIITPLQKIKGFGDEAYTVLADAMAYHPSKLPVQAYADLQKMEDGNSN